MGEPPSNPDETIYRSDQFCCVPYRAHMLVGACVDRFTAANGLREFESQYSASDLFSKCIGCSTGQRFNDDLIQLNDPSRRGLIERKVLALRMTQKCRVCTLPTETRDMGVDGRCAKCKKGGRVKDGAGPLVPAHSISHPAVDKLTEGRAPAPVSKPRVPPGEQDELIAQYLQLLRAIELAKKSKKEFEDAHPGVVSWLRKMIKEE